MKLIDIVFIKSLKKTIYLIFILIIVILSYANDNKNIFSLLDVELDPYYSNVGYYKSFSDTPIKDLGEIDEINLYTHLLYSYQKAEFFLIEASINPLPIAGVYMKKNHPDIYKSADINNDFNYIESLTAGFEEPYAISFFLGNFVTFTSPKQKRNTNNKGFFGYLFSVGDKHIKDNEIINDNWFELEVKVKGDRKFEHSKLSYSFRFGTKVHNHPNIQDIFMLDLEEV